MSYVSFEPLERELSAPDEQTGAVVEFVGTVRADRDAEGHQIEALDYEAYVPMAESRIDALVSAAQECWTLRCVHVRHRLGRVPVGEVSVLVRVESGHRAEAFDACRFLIDAIKADVPIWKHNVWSLQPLPDSSHVEQTECHAEPSCVLHYSI